MALLGHTLGLAAVENHRIMDRDVRLVAPRALAVIPLAVNIVEALVQRHIGRVLLIVKLVVIVAHLVRQRDFVVDGKLALTRLPLKILLLDSAQLACR